MELIHTCYRITDVDRSVAFYEARGADAPAKPVPVEQGRIISVLHA